MSGKTLLVALLALALFGAWRHFRAPETGIGTDGRSPTLSASAGRDVWVYGRDNCGYTQTMLLALDQAGAPTIYRNIDAAAIRQKFHDRFDASALGDGCGYALPVVLVAGSARMRPEPDEVVSASRTALTH